MKNKLIAILFCLIPLSFGAEYRAGSGKGQIIDYSKPGYSILNSGTPAIFPPAPPSSISGLYNPQVAGVIFNPNVGSAIQRGL